MYTLYHITSRDNLQGIAKLGMKPNSYWSTDLDLADYYKETVIDEGHKPVILTIQLNDVAGLTLEPDYPGLEEPITTVLHKSEDQVQSEWARSAKDWKASIAIINSLRIKDAISPERLYVMDDFGGDCPLVGYAAVSNSDLTSDVSKMNSWLQVYGIDNFNIRYCDDMHTIKIYAGTVDGITSVWCHSPNIPSIATPKEIQDLPPSSRFTGGHFYEIMNIWRNLHAAQTYEESLHKLG